jgi:hypothetical protein
LDEGVFNKIFSAATGVWTLVLMCAVALFKAWPNVMERFNERRRDAAAEEAGDWERVRSERDRLRDRLHICEERIDLLEQEKGEWMRRAITAEATLQGYGEARQRQAIEAAAKRLTDERPPDAKNNGK